MVMEAERRGAEIQRELRGVDPRVVEIYETGDLDGYFFVAMQFVEGRDLAEVLREEHTIDSVRAAAIALEICEQLTKFHTWQRSVVHGDIKPSNIHLGPNDTVRLLDFGIAKTLRADSDATVAHFGSPSYCSPERLARSEVDEQSDLWAVGATLYQMISGSPPYQAEDTYKLESLIRSKRPPRALPSSCPVALRAIAMKALAPDAGRRYRTAREFQADLQAFLENRPVRAELERRNGWSAGATMARIRKMTHTVVQFHRHVQVATGAVWFLLGMALWIGGTLGVEEWNRPPLTMEVSMPKGPGGPAKLEKVPGFEVEAPVAPVVKVVSAAKVVPARKKGKGGVGRWELGARRVR
jgi:serine/threonine protein kinase